MITNVMYSSKSDEWETPQAFFDTLNNEFHFTLDPCSTHENAKCSKHYTKSENGLLRSWKGETVFCNPPYGRNLLPWVQKCSQEAENGTVIVMLIPSRTDTKAFHDYIYGKAQIRFIRGRLKFGNARHNAPSPSMLVVFNGGENGATGANDDLGGTEDGI